MIARTSACRPESPVCCISTETAILPENITVSHLPQTPCHRARIPPAEPPQAEYDRGYGDTGRSHSQTRKPQLGASHCAVARSAY
jgi:hypothetical protein